MRKEPDNLTLEKQQLTKQVAKLRALREEYKFHLEIMYGNLITLTNTIDEHVQKYKDMQSIVKNGRKRLAQREKLILEAMQAEPSSEDKA